MKTVTWFCNIDASIGVMNSKQMQWISVKGKKLKVVEQVQYVNFYSLLAKKKAQQREADIAHKKFINVYVGILSVYFRINCSLKIKLNKTNPSHLFSQLLKSVLSEVDALTRLLYETLYRELVNCNKLQALAEYVKDAFQKSFPDPS